MNRPRFRLQTVMIVIAGLAIVMAVVRVESASVLGLVILFGIGVGTFAYRVGAGLVSLALYLDSIHVKQSNETTRRFVHDSHATAPSDE